MKDNFTLAFILYCFLAVSSALPPNKGYDSTRKNQTSSAIRTKSKPQFPDPRFFDWELCKALHATEKKNAVVSSLSAKLVLLMIYEGALGNTAKQIEQSIGFYGYGKEIKQLYSQKLQSLQDHEKDDYELTIGTKLFMDTSVKINNEFLTSITASYNSSYEKIDFSKTMNAVNSINQWAEFVTHGRIKELITADETDENTVLLLLNAIYFKGSWKNPFDKNLTKTGTFYLNSQSTVDVPLMTTYNDFNISTLRSLNARLLSLPYEGDKFVMYIILPDSLNGLDELISTFNPSILTESIQNISTVFAKVVVPKFNFEYTSILRPLLKKLGITDMFGSNANLSNIGFGPSGNLVVSDVLQKAGIEVNEEGSTAHAVTEVAFSNRFGESVELFEVNRPFLFMLEDTKTHTIVFVGQVVNPLSQSSSEVSVPLNNIPEPVKPLSEDVDLKINVEQDVNFQRFNYFDSELFEELSSNEHDSNFVASPISIKIILSLLSEGARGNTLKQLYTILRLPNDQSTRNNLLRKNQLSLKSSLIDVVVINNIFVNNNNKVSNNFKETANDLYSSNITEINFGNIDASIEKINKQVSSDTKGLVKKIISKDDLDGNIKLLLANILYFKGAWLIEFNEKKTKHECFYPQPDVCVAVSMMNLNEDIHYQYLTDINAHAVELLYKDTNFSMVILLPDGSITNLFRDLQHYSLSKVFSSFQLRNVNLYLPRFNINYSTKLMPVLQKMRLTSIFEQNANLSSIFDPVTQVFVKDVLHKVTIEVNEKGSRASAVTALTVMTLSYSPKLPPVTVNVNKPFAFFIINRVTQTILFGGQMLNMDSIYS